MEFVKQAQQGTIVFVSVDILAHIGQSSHQKVNVVGVEEQ
jgi:hypothetical protein